MPSKKPSSAVSVRGSAETPPPSLSARGGQKAGKSSDRWRESVFLPQTDFPMRGRLPETEPDILRLWDDLGLYERQRQAAQGREKFVLHDGPPYANGELHMGTALNKILKDIINRSRQITHYDANYVPGWDCHGLPIEWKVEEEYRAQGKSKDDLPAVEFRRRCRGFAEKWIDIQRAGFRRFGVIGDWQDPYLTMSPLAEGQIVRELGKFLDKGALYRGVRPVLWSVPEKTALADAEVEYLPHTSPSIWVAYPLRESVHPVLAEKLADTAFAVWTTTPWTVPMVRAIAYAEDADYSLLEVKAAEDSGVLGKRYLVASALAEAFCEVSGLGETTKLATLKGSEFAGTFGGSPLRCEVEGKPVYDADFPLLPADFVTLDQGTGFVQIAPSHGADDYALCQAHDIAALPQMDGESCFAESVPLFAGTRVLRDDGSEGDSNKRVLEVLASCGTLLASRKLNHPYPHSWRSKAPLIFRVTPQWFISMEKTGLRDTAMQAISDTRFYPPESRERLRSMVDGRPDWCVSRQRLWGVPLPLFTHKQTGEVLNDPQVIERIAQAYEKENSDLWFTEPASRWLAPDYDADEWQQEEDIVEVWFDSGSTHGFVLEKREDLKPIADLYLEGTDQHRGWFQSSLLVGCGTRGRAPYDGLLTHGFVLDDVGQKMSKSLGNTTDPKDVLKDYGADILRLWVTTADYTGDLRIGPKILKQTSESYRRLRYSLRYLLGGLHGFSEGERIAPADMPLLEKWLLHRLWLATGELEGYFAEYDFHRAFVLLHQIAGNDLSSFYFDIRKDSLYCDAPTSEQRQAVRSTFDLCFDFLATWLSPILSFTTEAAWQARGKDLATTPSMHLNLVKKQTELAAWQDRQAYDTVESLRPVRRVITGALERARTASDIGASLEASVRLWLDSTEAKQAAEQVGEAGLADWAIVSGLSLADAEEKPPTDAFRLDEVPGVAVVVEKAQGAKCERCWQVLPEVVADAESLCFRCRRVVGA